MKYLGSKTDPKDLVSLEKLLSYGTTLGAASNALTLKNSAGTVLSTLTAANLVTVLGNTAVAVASKVGTATKGATNLPVYVNAGTPTAVTSVGEAYLSWGGKNFVAAYGPIDAAMVPALGANRSAFAKAAGIVVEYSRDGGDTWTDYEAADATKIALFSGILANLNIGKSDSSHKATEDYKLRVTLNTSAAGIYTTLNKFVIYLNTNGSTGCTCTITARLQSDYESQIETWRTFADKVKVSGWSGYNVINTSGLTTYGNTKASHYGQVRFLFECTGGSNTYNGLVLYCIFCFGGVGWTAPSTMASKGSLFSYDALQNATFPANITCANLYAKTNNAYDIGTASKKWANVYATTLHGILDGKIGTATVGSSNKPIYLNAGVPTSISIINGTANVERPILVHNSGEIAGVAGITANQANNTLTVTSTSGQQQEFRAKRTGGSDVALMVGTGNHNHGVYSNTASKWIAVCDASGNVTLNGNAESATKLKTARTIWGRSFDGSANVSGAMSGVTSLAMSGALSGATTGSFSSNLTVGGTLTMSGSSKRIYFGTDYIELVTVGGVKCLHSNVGFYSDSFVSAGGIGSGGGGGSIVNVKSLSEVLAYSGSEVMTDVPTAYAVHSMYNTLHTAIAGVVKTQSSTFHPGSIALWTGSGKNLMTCESLGSPSKPIYLEDGIPKACTHTVEKDVPSNALFTDTKNTSGATSKAGTKMFLVAATSQAASPQTYSNASCYIGDDDCLYSGGQKVETVEEAGRKKQPWKVVVKKACPVFALRQGYLYYTASHLHQVDVPGDNTGIDIVVSQGHINKRNLVPSDLAVYLQDALNERAAWDASGRARALLDYMQIETSDKVGMVWMTLGAIPSLYFEDWGSFTIENLLPCAMFGFRGAEWRCDGFLTQENNLFRPNVATASPFLRIDGGIVICTKTVPPATASFLAASRDFTGLIQSHRTMMTKRKKGFMVSRRVSWRGGVELPERTKEISRKGFKFWRREDSASILDYSGPVRFYAVHRGVKSVIFTEVTMKSK